MNALLQPYYVHRIFNPTYHILLRILHALYVTYPSLSGSLAVTDRVVSHHAFGKVLVDMAQDLPVSGHGGIHVQSCHGAGDDGYNSLAPVSSVGWKGVKAYQ